MLKFTGGCRGILVSLAAVLLIVSLFQIWLFREGAVKEIQEKQMQNDGNALPTDKEEMLRRKYFRGRSFALNKTTDGFGDSKRKIPSCPDPLHN